MCFAVTFPAENALLSERCGKLQKNGGVSGGTSAGQKAKKQNDNGGDQQQMDETAQQMRCQKPDKPQNEKYHGNSV